jgi:hypothetical protein
LKYFINFENPELENSNYVDAYHDIIQHPAHIPLIIAALPFKLYSKPIKLSR